MSGFLAGPGDLFRRLFPSLVDLFLLPRKFDELKLLTAKLLIQKVRSREPLGDIREAEFKVFSQFGDDGIIQYLIRHVPVSKQSFVEFGVEDYKESNTRFLLVNDNWKGLVLDQDSRCVRRIRRDPVYWKHDLTAVRAFIDRDNINGVFEKNGFRGPVGLLSIDMDGNDYWVWERIDVIDPDIVIAEYNSVFGPRHAITVPYDPAFRRTKAHYSNLFWGCSLKALCRLAEKKSYVFAGSNSAGNNAYFVKKAKAGNLKSYTVESGYVESKFRESRDPSGALTYISGGERLRIIEDMTVYDLERERLVKIKELES